MLGIILLLLKIVGISLLVILGLVLFIVLFLIFVPIRYRAKGYLKDGKFQVFFDIYYFFDWISFTLSFEKKLLMYIRVFSIKIYLDKFLKGKKKSTKSKGRKKELDSKTDLNEQANGKINKDEIKKSEEEIVDVSSINENSKIDKESDINENLSDRKDSDTSEKLKDKNESDSSEDSNEESEADSSDELKDDNSSDEKNSEGNNDKGIFSKISDYVAIIKSDYTKMALKCCLHKIGLLLKSILPSKGYIDLVVGTGDAGVVGEILGIYKALYMYIGKCIHFKPVFTEKKIEIKFDIKGKISIFIILYYLVTLYFDKNFRKLMNSLKKV